MSARVTGFGRRPSAGTSTRTTGPAFESRQGRKSRDWGTRLSGRYGDLYERTAVKRGGLTSLFLFPCKIHSFVRSEEAPFFRPDPCVCRSAGAQDLSRTGAVAARPKGLSLIDRAPR